MERSLDPAGAALLSTGALVVASLALTESFEGLLAALPAYAAAWWVLGLEREAPGSGKPR